MLQLQHLKGALYIVAMAVNDTDASIRNADEAVRQELNTTSHARHQFSCLMNAAKVMLEANIFF